MEQPNIKVGQRFPLTIKKIGINGEGIGYFKKKITFVTGLLPSEEAVVQVVKTHPKYIEAKIVKIRKTSKDRVKPKCNIFDMCGGCQLQHMKYSSQLVYKQQIVIDALNRYAKHIPTHIVKETYGMKYPYEYRNKNQFPVRKQGNKVIAGLYKENSHELIDVKECIVQDELNIKVTEDIKALLKKHQINICKNPKKDKGVRHIVTRISKDSKEIQVVLVVTNDQLKQNQSFTNAIMNLTNVTSYSLNINKEKTSKVFGDKTVHVSGKRQIREKLKEYYFDLSPDSFFQLNPEQATIMYDEIKKQANLSKNDIVVDAFCGTGTIGIWLANHSKEVHGMDLVEEGIKDANNNAKLNLIDNASFETGDAFEIMGKWIKRGLKPDVITIDPPRTGLNTKAINLINKVKPKTFIYTSCNPSTLAKDLAHLSKSFKVVNIQPIDMFPQTAQVEVVTKLVAK